MDYLFITGEWNNFWTMNYEESHYASSISNNLNIQCSLDYSERERENYLS